MNCVYIGDRFYRESGTMISPVYEIKDGGYSRTDWGFIQIALEKGEELHIRPAMVDEISFFEKKMEECNKAMEAIGFTRG